ncbi:MAG: hypothetical protein GY699_07070 [Desulfobacteraceae bacterium]|nr:hypothetical protein [Desulfobacteraceae bacterium]
MKKKYSIHPIIFTLFISLFIFTGQGHTAPAKEDIKTIAILPFQINASQELDYIRNGMVRMFNSRLSWREKVTVIPKNAIAKHLPDLDDISGTERVARIARLTHSNFILTGSITGIGGAFSIDINVYDIENKRYITFFEQSKTIDTLIGKTDKIAAIINKKVFDRTTMSWEKIEQEKLAYIKELKRRNPEYMMQNPQWREKKESPGWKIWEYLY